jgi:hypothetical protein
MISLCLIVDSALILGTRDFTGYARSDHDGVSTKTIPSLRDQALDISNARLFLLRDDSLAREEAADDAKLFLWNAPAGEEDFADLWARDSENNLTVSIPAALK